MAMDVLERLNRKFGVWYEGLFGGADSGDLRPRDILRRILTAMEDGRREALDGKVYVPNVYTLQIAVDSDDERDYLRTFLNAEDLASAVSRSIEQHGYQVRGPLVFTVEEMPAGKVTDSRVHIRCRFDAALAAPAPVAPSAVESTPPPDLAEDGEPGTVPAIPGMGMAPLASLVVRSSDGHLQDVYPLTAHGARIGRGRSAGNDILLTADAMISKSHARIVYENGVFHVRDENSTNGTFMGPERLIAGKAYPLHSGDEIRLGQTVMGFRLNTPTPAPTQPSPVTPPQALYTDLRPMAAIPDAEPVARRPFRLVNGSGESYPLASAMTVGRGLTSDIVAIGVGVATQHARLSLRGETVYVEDLRTPGGTAVNGERIPSDFPVALYEGDQIAFGEVTYRLERGAGGGWR